MSDIVCFKQVRKSFGDAQVLKGVSFSVAPGQVVALIGRSGSGKTTALRCINGLETIQDGQLHVCGRALERGGHDLLALRQEVGIVFQAYNLFPHLTVLQNVKLAPCKVKGLPDARADALARSWTRWACGTAPTTTRSNCPADSSNARRSPARWPCSPS